MFNTIKHPLSDTPALRNVKGHAVIFIYSIIMSLNCKLRILAGYSLTGKSSVCVMCLKYRICYVIIPKPNLSGREGLTLVVAVLPCCFFAVLTQSVAVSCNRLVLLPFRWSSGNPRNTHAVTRVLHAIARSN